MIIVNDLRPGVSFEHEGNIYSVLDVDRNKTAMRQMIVKIKVKNLRTGVINEISFVESLPELEYLNVENNQINSIF